MAAALLCARPSHYAACAVTCWAFSLGSTTAQAASRRGDQKRQLGAPVAGPVPVWYCILASTGAQCRAPATIRVEVQRSPRELAVSRWRVAVRIVVSGRKQAA